MPLAVELQSPSLRSTRVISLFVPPPTPLAELESPWKHVSGDVREHVAGKVYPV